MRVAALAALLLAGLAGCGGSGTGGAGSGASGAKGRSASATSNTTPPGHTFIDLVGELPASLDETATPDAASTGLLPSWSSELVRPKGAAPGPDAVLAPDDAVVPYLAISWQRDPNGDYTFRLRRGVRGVSGDPFTAADVKWSLERAVARSPVAPFLFALGHIDSANPVTVLDPHRVRINVTAPSPFTLSVLASYDVAIYDSALYRSHATAADPWAQNWGSTHSGSFGAYWVAWFWPRHEIELDANPGFWRTPYYARVLVRQVVNAGTRVDEVLGGAATHTSDLPWGNFETAVNSPASDDTSATILQTGPGVIAWHLDVASGPLANPLVRQALNLGVNRIEMANALDDGFDDPTVLTIPAALGQPQPTVFDPVQARSLLRTAGYPQGVTIDIYTNEDQAGGQAYDLLAILRAQMLQLGVFLRITFIDDTDQLLALEQHHQLQSTIDVITPLLGGAGFLIEQNDNVALDPVSPAANQRYSNATLQPLLDQLGNSPPGAAAAALIHQAAAIVDGDVPTVNFVAVPIQNVTRAGITGYAAYAQPVTYYEYLHPAR
jgi:peptide/nickel transport system substrate-binding protein